MHYPQLEVQFEHGFAIYYGANSSKDESYHNHEADFESYGEVGDFGVGVRARFLERIKSLIDEVGDKDGYDNDHCRIEELASRCNLIVSILSIISYSDQDGQGDG